MPETREKLSTISVAMHWVIAVAMIALIAFGLILEDMPKGETKSALVQIHKSFGVIVLLLASVRLVWRFRRGMPEPMGAYTRLEKTLAAITHGFLLLATLLMPLSGILLSVGSARPVAIFGIPFLPQILAERNDLMAKTGAIMHAVGGKLVILFIVLHVGGALKHHVIDKDGTLRRMLGQRVTPAKLA